MTTRKAVFPDHPLALYALHRDSPAVQDHGLLFISGQVGARDDGSPEPDAELQIRRAFVKLNAVLAAAGCTFDNVIDVMMPLVEPERDLPTVLKAMDEHWGDPPHPALTAIGVTWLAGFRFEIKAIARIRKGPSEPTVCRRFVDDSPKPAPHNRGHFFFRQVVNQADVCVGRCVRVAIRVGKQPETSPRQVGSQCVRGFRGQVQEAEGLIDLPEWR